MNQSNDIGIGEQALGKAIALLLSSQLEDAKDVEVKIRSQPLQMVQGQADSITVHGEGLVTSQNFRVENLVIRLDRVAIDLLNAVLGKIELTHSVDASAQIALTEADLNLALQSQYLRDRLQDLSLRVGNEVVRLSVQQIALQIPAVGQLATQVQLQIQREAQMHPISISGVLQVVDRGNTLILKQAEFAEGQELTLAESAAILSRLNELVHLRQFQINEVVVQIEQITVERDRLCLWLKADIEKIPEF